MLFEREKLVVALRQAYAAPEDVRTVCDQAGLPHYFVNYNQAADRIWRDIVREHHDALPKIVEIVLRDERKKRFHDAVRAARISKREVMGRSAQCDDYLLCDRGKNWDSLKGLTGDPQAHVFLLCGSPDDGHSYLLDRIRRRSYELDAAVLSFDRAIFDLHPRRAMLALRDPLEAPRPDLPPLDDLRPITPERVPEAIARIMEEKSLILIYPEASAVRWAAWLNEHHGQAIPALFSDVCAVRDRVDHALLAVQPLVWEPGSHAAVHRALKPLIPHADPDAFQHFEPIGDGEVHALIRRVYAGDRARIDAKIAAVSAKLRKDRRRVATKVFAVLRELLSEE
jgi:hypothetical protein